MKKKYLGLVGLIAGFLLIGFSVFAADGDLVVNGNVGIGTANPAYKLDIFASSGGLLRVGGSSAEVLDQSQTSIGSEMGYSWYGSPNAQTAQTFKANNTGKLLKASFGLKRTGTRSATLYLELYVAANNVPTGSVLATSDPINWSAVPTSETLVDFNFTGAQQYQVVSGNDYAIVVRSSDESFNTSNYLSTFGNTSNAYTNGNWARYQGSWVAYTSYDAGFRTYVSADQASLVVNAAGNVGMGTTNPGSYKLYVNGTAYSTGGWVQSSDLKFKENIAPIESPLSKILNLRGVSFNWRTEEFRDKGYPENKHYGVIAEEIELVLPEVVKEGPEKEKGVSYGEIIPVLIEAIKEQQKEIERLKSEVIQLQTKN